MKDAYQKIPSTDSGDDMGDEDDYDYGNEAPGSRRQRGQSVTLGTLATGGNRTIDLKACYKRAMEARHLSTDEVFVTINPQEIELITTIGEGSFGTVWTGIWRNNSVAVKEFGFAQSAIHGDSQQSESLVEEIIGEAGLMTCLRHPKILQLYGCSLTPQAVWIVCELCERGSLRMLLDDAHTPLPNEHKLSLCMDVADGMQYLHRRKKPIIHRDLKRSASSLPLLFPAGFYLCLTHCCIYMSSLLSSLLQLQYLHHREPSREVHRQDRGLGLCQGHRAVGVS
jgi:hypothetical protein